MLTTVHIDFVLVKLTRNIH